MDRRTNGCGSAVCRKAGLLFVPWQGYFQLFRYNGRFVPLRSYNPAGNKKKCSTQAAVQRPFPVFLRTGFLLLPLYIHYGSLLVSFRKKELSCEFRGYKLLFSGDTR